MISLSGTESVGATIRLYLERTVTDKTQFKLDRQDLLTPIIEEGYKLCDMHKILGDPTLIT